MKKTSQAIFLAGALAFSMGAIAQTGGGSGNPTQGMEKDADKAHAQDHKTHAHKSDKKMKHSSSSDSVSPVMQTTPDGKSKTPDATVPAGK